VGSTSTAATPPAGRGEQLRHKGDAQGPCAGAPKLADHSHHHLEAKNKQGAPWFSMRCPRALQCYRHLACMAGAWVGPAGCRAQDGAARLGSGHCDVTHLPGSILPWSKRQHSARHARNQRAAADHRPPPYAPRHLSTNVCRHHGWVRLRRVPCRCAGMTGSQPGRLQRMVRLREHPMLCCSPQQ
jgi:hypothetical protein